MLKVDFEQAGLNLSLKNSLSPRARAIGGVARLIVSLGVAFVLSSGCLCGAQTQGRGQRGLQQPPTQVQQTNQTASAPQKVGIETSQQLFATMCALWAAGFNTEANLGALPPAWRRVAEQVSKQQGPATDALRQYYQQHPHNIRETTIGQYVAFAMTVGPPPDFAYTLRHDDLPPEVLTIGDFTDVLANFYKEAGIESLWSSIEPAYDPAIARLQGPLTKIVQQTTGYLREVVRTDSPRTFSVYVEPMVGANTNFRTYADHYVLVVDGGDDMPLDEIRHAFLHYLLDSLPVRYYTNVIPTKPLLNIAARAPRLPHEYKDDLGGFYTECLIKAVEIQLNHLTADQRAHAIDVQEADGFVLVRPMVAQLDKFQQEEPSMTYYFQDMAKAIDVAAETKRLADVKFAPAEDSSAPAAPDPVAVMEAEKEKMLDQAEHLMAAHDPVHAQPVFEQIEKRWPGTPRAIFGLALCSAMQGNNDRAKELFTSLTKLAATASGNGGAPGSAAVDPVILSWSHVYLGRFDDHDDLRAQAVAEYKAALAVKGAPEAARKAAQLGVDKPYQSEGKDD